MIAFGNNILSTFGSGTAFAVIDTGTTMLGLPEAIFKSLQSKWLSQIGSDINFRCDDAALKMGYC